MRFTMSHEFRCPPEKMWEVYEDDEFERRLQEATQVRREVLEEREEDGVQIKRLRCVAEKELPKPMKMALGIEQFEYEQEQRLDRKENLLEWKVVTPFMTDRVHAAGTTRVEPTERGCRRKVEGDIQVRLPLVGKKMEQNLARRLQTSYEEAVDIAREMLEEEGTEDE